MKRTDANPVALRAVRAILLASHDLSFTLADGTAVRATSSSIPPTGWPAEVEGLSEERDGPWPPEVRVHYDWGTGSADVRVCCDWWRTRDRVRHLVGIKIWLDNRVAEVVWSTFGTPLLSATSPGRARVLATLGFTRAKDQEDAAHWNAWRDAVRAQAAASDLPRPTPASVLLCELDVPSGEVFPSPEAAFARVVQLGLLKLTVLCRHEPDATPGTPAFRPLMTALPTAAPVSATTAPSAKRMGLWSMPGGVRSYRDTLEQLLAFVAAEPCSRADVNGFLADTFDVRGETSRKSYVNLMLYLGLAEETADGITLTEPGEAWLAEPEPGALFKLLHAHYDGVLALLVLVAERGALDTEGADALQALLGTSWKTNNQVSFRRNWLLSLGLTEREHRTDQITPAGIAVLDEHAAEAEPLRAAVRALGGPPDAPGGSGAEPPEGPTGTGIEEDDPALDDPQLVLTEALVAPHTGRYHPPPRVLAQCCAALSAGRHLLLVGPPGTGKTELAGILADAAASEGYCSGLRTATASADWTTFDTIGGYALTKSSGLRFRPGIFPRALEENRWLLIDELNRADVDKAFGELMTVLSHKATTTPYEDDAGAAITIGPEPDASYRVRKAFRVIATMNTWDKTSLFRLSSALQRRFATVHVGLPDDATTAELLATEAGKAPAIPEDLLQRVVRMFRHEGLLKHRAVGPAVPLDMLRYLRHCPADSRSSHGLAEAVAVSLLSQLEGLTAAQEHGVLAQLQAEVEPVSAPEAWQALADRLAELFQHVKPG